MKRINSLEECFEQTVALCEANSFEQSTLWKDWSLTAYQMNINDGREDGRDLIDRQEWEDYSLGFGREIGTIGDLPIFVSFLMARINGRVVTFYYPTSRAVDYDQIEKFVDEHFVSCSMRRDADNFGDIINYVNKKGDDFVEVE